MSRRRDALPETMLDRVGAAIAEADGGDFASDVARYRRLAEAALGPIARPTEGMIDAAHEAVSFNSFGAINSRSDFKRAVKAMVNAALRERGSERAKQ